MQTDRLGKAIKHPILWLALLLILHAVLLIYVQFTPDSHFYLDIARTVADGEGIGTYQLTLNSREMPARHIGAAPGYPLLLSPWIAAGLSDLMAARIVGLGSMLAILICMYLFAERIESRNAGIIALILWAATGTGLEFATSAWTEAPFIAFSMLALVLASAAVDGSGRLRYSMLVAAGIIAGLAACTRYVGVTVLLAILLSMAWMFVRSIPKASRWRWIAGMAVVSICFAIPFGMAWGRDTIVAKHVAETGTFSDGRWVGHWYQYVARGIGVMVRDLWLLLAIGGTCIALTCNDASRACWQRLIKRRDGVSGSSYIPMLCAWVIVYTVVIFALCALRGISPEPHRVLTPSSRYLCPAYPGIWVLAAIAVARLSSRNNLRLGTIGLTVVALMLTGYAGVLVVQERIDAQVRRSDYLSSAEHVQWIKDYTQPDDILIASDARYLNFQTRRAAVRVGYPTPELTPERLHEFKSKFRTPYNSMYLCEYIGYNEIPDEHIRKQRQLYAAAGVSISLVKQLRLKNKVAVIWSVGRYPEHGTHAGPHTTRAVDHHDR